MKNIKKSLYLFCMLLAILQVQTMFAYNGTISNSAPILGNVAEDTTGKGYGGELVFPDSSVGVKVNASPLNTSSSSDLSISGDFWLQNLSSTTDGSLGWATFDIGTVSGASEVYLDNQGNNTFVFKGYAWSRASGWIYFGDNIKDASNNLIPNSKVVYNRGTGTITGCGWSENIGWVCLDGLTLDTTVPNLTNIETYKAANHQEIVTIPNVETVDVEKYNSTGKTTYTTVPFTHNFQTAKPYTIIAEDKSGNKSEGVIRVVANIPSMTGYNGTTPSVYSSDYSASKIGDGNDKHNINFTPKDKYGNIVKDVDGVKDVEVGISFNNNVDKNQLINSNSGDAISYNSSQFNIVSPSNNSFTGTSLNGNYSIDISSFAPTKAGYNKTTNNNDISVKNINVVVTGLNSYSGVGEGINNSIFNSNYSNKNFKFTPVIKIDSITNDKNWNIIRDTTTYFTGIVDFNKSSGAKTITNLELRHILDAGDNSKLSFQGLAGVNSIEECYGYKTSTGYQKTDDKCEENSSSNILKTYDGPINGNISDSFKGMLRVISPGVSNYDFGYSSEVSYDIGGINIKYPSHTETKNQNLVNNEVKIAGISNKNSKSFNVISDTSIKSIGNITKMDVYSAIRKNVVPYQKSGSIGKVQYSTGTVTVNDSSFTGIDTIIVNGADVIISGDINKVSGKIKSIIALKDRNGNGGNILIGEDVQFIGAVLVADKSIISDYSTKQLFIKGSVISYNTIGGSSKTPASCPYYITTTCDIETAKRYDYNHLRAYINGDGEAINGADYGVDMSLSGYSTAPVIIEYDSEISKNLPSVFKIQ